MNDGGTGIGLMFCKKIANLLKVKIELSSLLNVGSIFSLVIHNNVSNKDLLKRNIQ